MSNCITRVWENVSTLRNQQPQRQLLLSLGTHTRPRSYTAGSRPVPIIVSVADILKNDLPVGFAKEDVEFSLAPLLPGTGGCEAFP